jgi:hypothetical protein
VRHGLSMFAMSSESFVRILTRVGFVVYRSGPPATLLERGTRAVVVPERTRLSPDVVFDLRKMAGLTWRELETLVADLRLP